MSVSKASADPFKRYKTRHRGISYRNRSGGKTYSVYHGGRYWPVDGGEAEAVALQADLRGKAARGEASVTATKTTFNEVAEKWYESKHRLRSGTRNTYRSTLDRILLPRFGPMKIASLNVEHVAKLIRDLEREGLLPTTIQAYLQPLRSVMSYAVRRGLRTGNPCDQLTSDDRPHAHERKPDHVWSDDEIKVLVDAAERIARQPESRYDYSPLIRTALATGLRLGEVLGLTWIDVDFAEGTLHVRRQWTRMNAYGPTKTKAAVRRVPLSADMVSYLRELKIRSAHSKDNDPVFAGNSGKPLQHRNATRRGFEPAAKKASIEGVSFHDTRHAFASRMISRGVDPIMLAKLLGHESPVITLQRYTHLYDKQRTDEIVRQAMAW